MEKKEIQVKENYKARGNNVLVKLFKESDVLFGNIIKGEVDKNTVRTEPYAEVISVGPQVQDLKPGMLVMINTHGKTTLDLSSGLYKSLWETDILAIITKELSEEITSSRMSDKIKDKIVN